ncbi:MAG: hypothetical protein ACOCUW_01660, partial [Gemmatimonadota bacterium]
MRSRRTFIPTVLAIIGVPAVVGAQDFEMAAAPPDDAEVYEFDIATWEEPVCTEASAWSFEVPAGQWVEFPIGWIAEDHPTAVHNWDSIDFEILADGEPLEVPDGLNWGVDPIHFECDSG